MLYAIIATDVANSLEKRLSARPAHVERLTRAQRHDLHLDASLRGEDGQDVLEQSGLLGRGGRGDRDRAGLRGGGRRDQAEKRCGDEGAAKDVHGSSPLR